MSAVGAATGLGCSIVVTLIVLIGGGVLLDQALGTAPLLTLIGVAIGLAAAGYQLYELTLIGRTDRGPGPLGRRLSRESARRPRDGDRGAEVEPEMGSGERGTRRNEE